MPGILIENQRLRLRILPAIGAGAAEFSLRSPRGAWQPIWRPAPESPSHFNDLACYLLAPWSNRIAAGRFTFAGRQIQLRPDWLDGTAIHGVVKDRPWTILDRSPISARLAFESHRHADLNWPWPFDAAARYELDEQSLEVKLAITNRSDSAMPAGLGFHPFFMRRLWNDHDDVAIRASLAGRYPAAGMIPTAPARADEVTRHLAAGLPLSTLDLDDVFAGFDPATTITWPASGIRASFTVSPNLNHTVLYSPPAQPHFCLEPVSMVNDGFNLLARSAPGTGVTTLAPGQSLSATMAIRIDAL
ncbi:MAG: hypothetical protein IT436_14795 [Phycisphaerales bacterium]|nr:hypothetical protein [Phycisphaerales bacterium]